MRLSQNGWLLLESRSFQSMEKKNFFQFGSGLMCRYVWRRDPQSFGCTLLSGTARGRCSLCISRQGNGILRRSHRADPARLCMNKSLFPCFACFLALRREGSSLYRCQERCRQVLLALKRQLNATDTYEEQPGHITPNTLIYVQKPTLPTTVVGGGQ